MVSGPESSDDHSQNSGSGQAAKRIAVLLSIDMAMVLGALACQDVRNGIGGFLKGAATYLHIPIGIWMGVILGKSYNKKNVLAVYWISVGAPFVLFIVPYMVIPFHLLFPFGVVPTSIFIQWSILIGILSKRYTKGRWPLLVAILFAIGGALLILANLSFETTEFGPLGMLFMNMLASPVLLVIPALIRFPSSEKIQVYVEKLQYTVYAFLGFSWIVYWVRAFAS